jgi:hypothetical protein
MVSTFSRRPTRYAKPDAIVFSPDWRLQAIVEIRNAPGAGAEWAAQTRRNLIQDELLPVSPFFLLALPDRLYLWRDTTGSLDAVPAEYEADGTAILSPYIGDPSARKYPLSNEGLDLAVTFWLRDLVDMRLEDLLSSPEYQWLLESGLYELVRDGRVDADPEA